MTQVIVYHLNGRRHVMTPVVSDEMSIADIAMKDVPDGVAWQIVDSETLAAEDEPVDLNSMEDAIQNFVDSKAAAKGYRSGDALVSYRFSSNTQWAQEAVTFSDWRDSVWLYSYNQLELVESGQIPPPASIAAFMASLPALNW